MAKKTYANGDCFLCSEDKKIYQLQPVREECWNGRNLHSVQLSCIADGRRYTASREVLDVLAITQKEFNAIAAMGAHLFTPVKVEIKVID